MHYFKDYLMKYAMVFSIQNVIKDALSESSLMNEKYTTGIKYFASYQ